MLTRMIFSFLLVILEEWEGKAKTWRKLLMNIEYELSDKLPLGFQLSFQRLVSVVVVAT
jgi:hypothetical protein